LPVEGRWRVHRTHYSHPRDQSTAVDLVRDAPLPEHAAVNADFASYRQPIVADGPGLVVVVVDGVPDNPPGLVNGYDMHGNYLVIDHENGSYSLFAHLIPGSSRVRQGQRVAMGQLLGLCGNSGKSTMPHLHWQVMDAAEAHRARGVPIRHKPYLKGGRLSSTRLEAGDVVEAAGPDSR
jgi:murein DD-endopeptidase MepM/ murein hydrolase activator NlpD